MFPSPGGSLIIHPLNVAIPHLKKIHVAFPVEEFLWHLMRQVDILRESSKMPTSEIPWAPEIPWHLAAGFSSRVLKLKVSVNV